MLYKTPHLQESITRQNFKIEDDTPQLQKQIACALAILKNSGHSSSFSEEKAFCFYSEKFKPWLQDMPSFSFLFPLFIFFTKQKNKKTKAKEATFYKFIWIKHAGKEKKEKAAVYLKKISKRHWSFEMKTLDGVTIGKMELQLEESFIWIAYLRNFTKITQSSQAHNSLYCFDEIGKHLVIIAYQLLDEFAFPYAFLALKQGWNSEGFYDKLGFQKAPDHLEIQLIEKANIKIEPALIRTLKKKKVFKEL